MPSRRANVPGSAGSRVGVAVQRFRVFTLEQANRVLPHVQNLTQDTRARLDELRKNTKNPEDSSEFEQQTRGILDRWARLIQELGAQPKGIFTVDFRSPDPNVVWCWAPDEHEICHRHFTWESFKDRIELEADRDSWLSWN